MTLQALVVDDSRTIRLILGRILRGIGLDVTDAADAAEGLTALDGGLAPDLVLVDWNMPGMSGLEFVETVRRPPYALSARIVMVTTETEVAQVIRALQAGADEYVMKPFTKESILEKLLLLGMDV